jgi:nicotinate phosphoribosyltransferase
MSSPEESPRTVCEPRANDNSFVNPMLTDLYQITMAYAYWKAGRHNEHSVFDMFFRKNPFKGEFTIFAGLENVLRFLESFEFTSEHLEYLRAQMPHCEPEFFEYLGSMDASELRVYGVAEGTVVFPRIPLLRIEGPLAVCQMIETTVLNLCNFASLMTTNAARFRLAAGPDKILLEFGLRRAQGPDGAMSATRYSYMGGFDGTANVLAGMTYGVPIKGTHAHSFVTSYSSLDELSSREIDGVDIVAMALANRRKMGYTGLNNGELAAFIAYAQAFPHGFLALVDTYDTLGSGVPNFICVAAALVELGQKPLGIRLDSGDLAYLSKEARKMLVAADEVLGTELAKCTIVASNDINEPVLHSLNDQGHDIDTFGIGTNLVTCQAQPALGMVYKLVEINGKPRIKLSQEITKVTIPGAKEAYRLIGAEGVPLLDLLVRVGESPPQPGRRLLCRHPFDERKRVYVTAAHVIPLLNVVWRGSKADASDAAETDAARLVAVAARAHGEAHLRARAPSVEVLRQFVRDQMQLIRADHLRHLNPTPYKVSVTSELYHFIHDLWMREVPVPELS